MTLAGTRYKAPDKPCEPFLLKDNNFIPEPSKPCTSPLRPISVNKGTTKTMTPCKPWQEKDEPYVRWRLLEARTPARPEPEPEQGRKPNKAAKTWVKLCSNTGLVERLVRRELVLEGPGFRRGLDYGVTLRMSLLLIVFLGFLQFLADLGPSKVSGFSPHKPTKVQF